MSKRSLGFFIVVLLLLMQGFTSVEGKTVQDFEFTLLDTSTIKLSEYGDKAIILDWAASWCPSCKENQKTFAKLYPEYKDYVEFLTISYGGSGDTLDKVQSMRNEGNYKWTFGLDHSNYAATVGASNADIWILDTNFELVKSWKYAVVNQNTLASELAKVVGVITTNATSEVTVTSNGTTFVETSTFETTSSIIPETENEVITFGLASNPFFLGFLGVSGVIAIVLGVAKVTKRS
ncbi:MAG: TlpA family protein disulfide reductase [Candidatus Kariarchaeaceae archaeon]|jgi:thiol-disulfide isomerase/thioredoxin